MFVPLLQRMSCAQVPAVSTETDPAPLAPHNDHLVRRCIGGIVQDDPLPRESGTFTGNNYRFFD
jgi:hypothetical protein